MYKKYNEGFLIIHIFFRPIPRLEIKYNRALAFCNRMLGSVIEHTITIDRLALCGIFGGGGGGGRVVKVSYKFYIHS